MKLVKRNVTDVFVLSDPIFRVSMQKQEKTIFLYYFVLIKGIYVRDCAASNTYLLRINSQITLDHLSYPCSGKTFKVVFALSDPMFRVYM